MSLIGFLGFIFLGMTLWNRILEGAMVSTTEGDVINQMTITRDFSIGGFFSVPVPNTEFLTGLQHLLKWDYSFFGGDAGIIQYFMYVFTFMAAFLALTIVMGLGAQYLTRR